LTNNGLRRRTPSAALVKFSIRQAFHGDAPLLRKAKSVLKSIPVVGPLLRAVARPFVTQEQEISFRRYCRLLPKLVPAPIFVKVGANDGITGDSISDILLADERWKGLLIEPVPSCFQALRKNFSDARRFQLEQVAIGTARGEAVFYFVDPAAARAIPDLPSWFDQLGSFDKNHILKHLNGALAPFIVEQRVPVRRLDDVLRENNIQQVHFLQIDAEGFDYEVLKTVNFAGAAPAAILAEHRHLGGHDRVALLELLREHGYRVDDCFGDFFAIHRTSRLNKIIGDSAVAQ
jgi:FkbM family methyltransferase